MKQFLLVLSFLVGITAFAQSPQSFKYQAVVRDNNGNVLVNKIVSIRTSILQGSTSGGSVYTETQSIATNDFGVIAINIGQGTLVAGNFSTINWGADIYFIKTEVDLTGGSNYQFMGTTQLMSVPYALYAAKSGASKNDNDTSATNEIQQLSLNGRNLSISSANSIQLPDDNDGDTTNEIQSLSINDHALTISKSNNITIPDNQTLTLNNNNLSITNGNTIVLPPDSDANPTNEIQAISLINDTLYLSNGGFVNLTHFKDNTDNQTLSINGNQLQISGGNSVTFAGAVDLDPDPLNELQYLSKSGDTLFLSQGNYVLIPPDADHDPTNEIQTITVTADSIKISNGGGAIKIPTPTNAIVPSGTCIYSYDKNPPFGYSYSGEYISQGTSKWFDNLDSLNSNIRIDYCEVIDTCIYFIYTPKNTINYSFAKYNWLTKTFTQLPSNFTNRTWVSSGLFGGSNNKLFLVGGGSSSSEKKICDMFDCLTNTWSRLTDIPLEITGGTKFIFTGHYLFLCSASSSGDQNFHKITSYNINTNQWVSDIIPYNDGNVFQNIGDSLFFGYYSAGSTYIKLYTIINRMFYDLPISSAQNWLVGDDEIFISTGTGSPATIRIYSFDFINSQTIQLLEQSSSLNGALSFDYYLNNLYSTKYKVDLNNPTLIGFPEPNADFNKLKIKKFTMNRIINVTYDNTSLFLEVDVCELPKIKYMHCAN